MAGSYKQKWLNALRDPTTTPSETANVVRQKTEEISSANVNATLKLRQLSSVLGEAARNAKSLTSLMDETRHSAGVDFGEIGHHIDGKLSQMDAVVIVRRLRDCLKQAEVRIGILSAACEELTDKSGQMAMDVCSLHANANVLQEAAVEVLMIGGRPSEDEMDDYRTATAASPFHRFDTHYEDVDSEWTFTQISKHTALREKKHSRNDSGYDQSDSDEDSDEPSNRYAQLVPAKNATRKIQPPSAPLGL